jgi:hypothetical protein
MGGKHDHDHEHEHGKKAPAEAVVERDAVIDVRTKQRLLQFINAARVPADLTVAPHDIMVVDEMAAHAGDIPHHVAPKRTLEVGEAKEIFKARLNADLLHGFRRFEDLVVIKPEILERLLELFSRARYGQWKYLYEMSEGGVDLSIEHAALLRTGEVIFIESGTDTILWDPSDETTPQFTVLPGSATGLTADLFCAGHSFLSDGQLLVVGGGGGSPGAASSIQAWRFDAVARRWQRTAGDLNTRRWYPTALTLGDEQGPTGRCGRVLIAGGSGGTAGMEVYWEATDRFVPITVNGPISKHFSQTYPGMHLLPGGEIFYAPVGFANCSTSNSVGYSDGPSAWFTFDAPEGSNSGHWTEISSPAIDRAKGMSVLVLQPSYPFVRVVVVGGGPPSHNASAQTINLSTFSPTWGPTSAIPDGRARVNVSTVLLPDSKILVCGGLQAAPYPTWIYDPNAVVNPWREVDENHRPRHYHSVALLLPSGKVMMAGGASAGGCSLSVENSIEVFSPPYLFNPNGTLAARPVITSVNDEIPTSTHFPQVHHGDAFTVQTSHADQIAKAVLIRPMAVTHQTDSEQRIIHMTCYKSGTNELTVHAPDGGGPHAMAPRGYYMLFLLNHRGTPSEAKFIHLH